MIYYNWMREGWCDTNDESFFVDYTPEGGVPEAEEGFKTIEEFLAWYNKED